jgi:Short C-terminal domain
MIIVFWLIFGTLFAFICSGMAKRRNRDGGLWGFLGFLFGLLTVIVLAIIGDAPTSGTQAYAALPDANANPKASNLDELAKLKGLLDAGVITQVEFDTQKAKLLS